MLALTGLKDARDRLAGRLSGGMKKGLALACALVHEPALLLLDEPTVGVDPVSRQELWDIIMRGDGRGHRLVFTSCYLEEAQSRRPAGRHGRGTAGGDHRRPGHGRERGVVGLGAAGARRRAPRCGPAWPTVAHEPRVYLRPEGLTVLADDEDGARRLLARDGGRGPSRAGDLARSALTFEDAFVLMEGAERRRRRARADGERGR